MGQYFDGELISELEQYIASGEVAIVDNIDCYVDGINSRLPIKNRKLDWSASFLAAGLEVDRRKKASAFSVFFQEVKLRYGLEGKVFYIGDGATDIVVLGDIDIFVKVLDYFVTIPQHHYFLAEDYSWFICFSIEGDMGFDFLKN
ncbi:hypothetical protein [Pseudomonas gessardii]|uniref:Uncharacterized protein n=1 Tax=Pseudomonas gessardii TaxID=78544 RepID=A0A7Y1QLA6_9PSED|nr:hypothetical protein [Pseudomonas gessardii]NNA95910.1 hypothetical protein [Pseudomonas gessardii]